MPCTYTPTPGEQAEAQRIITARLVKPYRDKLDTLTNMLCRVVGILHNTRAYGELDEDIREWYDQHLLDDRNRAQVAREAALAKLTDEDKRALGL